MANYISKYTGEQIDAAVAAYLAGGGTGGDNSGGSGDSGGSGSAASLNLWNHANDTVGNLGEQGAIDTSSTLYKVSDFIPFKTGETVHVYVRQDSANTVSLVNLSVSNGTALAMYDANKNFVADAWPTSTTNIDNPYTIAATNVAYIRLRLAAAHLDNTDRHYGVFKQAVTIDTFDEYTEGSSGGTDDGTDDSAGSGSTDDSTGTGSSASSLKGKNILVRGDSLSAGEVWQQELIAKGATVTTQALGGVGLIGMIDGETNDNGTLAALSVEDVTGKDAIILFGGTNNMRTERGEVGDGLENGGETTVTSLNKWNHALTEVGTLGEQGVVDSSATDYVVTDYIPFTTGESVYVYMRSASGGTVTLITPSVSNGSALAMYDADKNFLADVWPDSSTSIDAPYVITTENVAYIRFRLASAHFTNEDRHYGIFKQEVTTDTFDEYSEITEYEKPSTVAGYMQYAISIIYALLYMADNLTCRVLVVTPFCFGASEYNENAYDMDGVGLAQIIEDVANYHGIPVYNAYKNSGINPITLNAWCKSSTDRLHLNDAGYKHLGKLIAKFAEDNVLD